MKSEEKLDEKECLRRLKHLSNIVRIHLQCYRSDQSQHLSTVLIDCGSQ